MNRVSDALVTPRGSRHPSVIWTDEMPILPQPDPSTEFWQGSTKYLVREIFRSSSWIPFHYTLSSWTCQKNRGQHKIESEYSRVGFSTAEMVKLEFLASAGLVYMTGVSSRV
jgi:hypothetical protein